MAFLTFSFLFFFFFLFFSKKKKPSAYDALLNSLRNDGALKPSAILSDDEIESVTVVKQQTEEEASSDHEEETEEADEELPDYTCLVGVEDPVEGDPFRLRFQAHDSQSSSEASETSSIAPLQKSLVAHPLFDRVACTCNPTIVSRVPRNITQDELVATFKVKKTNCFSSSLSSPYGLVGFLVPMGGLFDLTGIAADLKNPASGSDDAESIFTPLQASLFGLMNSYVDIMYSRRTMDNAQELREVYALHALNHVMKYAFLSVWPVF